MAWRLVVRTDREDFYFRGNSAADKLPNYHDHGRITGQVTLMPGDWMRDGACAPLRAA
jgi:hypothetical protein